MGHTSSGRRSSRTASGRRSSCSTSLYRARCTRCDSTGCRQSPGPSRRPGGSRTGPTAQCSSNSSPHQRSCRTCPRLQGCCETLQAPQRLLQREPGGNRTQRGEQKIHKKRVNKMLSPFTAEYHHYNSEESFGLKPWRRYMTVLHRNPY